MTHHDEARLYGFSLTELTQILFCSSLQPSQRPSPRAVRAALYRTMNRGGDLVARCAEELAAHYGDDPDATCRRMRWALIMILDLTALAAA